MAICFCGLELRFAHQVRNSRRGFGRCSCSTRQSIVRGSLKTSSFAVVGVVSRKMEILRRSDETRANQDGLVDNSAASVFMRLGISAFSDEVSSAASLQSDSKSWLSNRSWGMSALLNLLKASSPQTGSALTLSITNRHSASDAIWR